MPSLAAIIGWILANPGIIAAGEAAIKDAINLVTSAISLHQAGVMTDEQLAAVWAAVGVDVQAADAAWDAAKAAHAKKGS